MRKHRAGSVWMILPLYLFTLIFVALPLLYVAALSFSTADGGYGVNWKFTLDTGACIPADLYGILPPCAHQHFDHLSGGLPLRILYGKAFRGQKEAGHAFPDAAFLGEFLDPSLWLDHHSPEKGPSELSADEAWHYPGALKNPVQLSCDRDRYDLCIAAVYGTVRIFQCGKAGLVPCGSCQRPRSQQMEGFLERYL